MLCSMLKTTAERISQVVLLLVILLLLYIIIIISSIIIVHYTIITISIIQHVIIVYSTGGGANSCPTDTRRSKLLPRDIQICNYIYIYIYIYVYDPADKPHARRHVQTLLNTTGRSCVKL